MKILHRVEGFRTFDSSIPAHSRRRAEQAQSSLPSCLPVDEWRDGPLDRCLYCFDRGRATAAEAAAPERRRLRVGLMYRFFFRSQIVLFEGPASQILLRE